LTHDEIAKKEMIALQVLNNVYIYIIQNFDMKYTDTSKSLEGKPIQIERDNLKIFVKREIREKKICVLYKKKFEKALKIS
jgi:hypothetical protein